MMLKLHEHFSKKKYFLFKSFVKVGKSELSYQIGVFSLVGNYLRPSNNSRPFNFNINAVVLIVISC